MRSAHLRRSCLPPLLGLLVSLALSSASAEGGINVVDARIQPGVLDWRLDADARIELTPAMRRGLDNGVPLDFVVAFRLLEHEPWWLDATLIDYEQRFRLVYFELTRHYRLQAIDTDDSRNYRSLMQALDALGRFRDLPVGRPTVVHLTDRTFSELRAELRIEFDSRALPLPLQPLIDSHWQLPSEVYAWRVD